MISLPTRSRCVYYVDMANKGAYLDWVMLADRAEVLSNKLYMMGGGWDRIQLPQFPVVYPLAIAIRITIPVDDVREDHRLNFQLLGAEGGQISPAEIGFRSQGARSASRPDVAMIALSTLVQFPEPGAYEVEVSIDGGDGTRLYVLVEQAPVS